MLWSGPLAAHGALSKVRPDEFLRKLDHRGHVAEADLFPPCVRRGGPAGPADFGVSEFFTT